MTSVVFDTKHLIICKSEFLKQITARFHHSNIVKFVIGLCWSSTEEYVKFVYLR